MKINEKEINKAVNEFVDDIFDSIEKSEGECEEKEEKSHKHQGRKMKKNEDELEEENEGELDEEEEDELECSEDEEDEEKSFKRRGAKMKKKLPFSVKHKKSLGANSRDEYVESLEKSVESLSSKLDSLSGMVEKLSKAPANLRKSVKGVDFVRKSQDDGQDKDIDENTGPSSLDLAKSKHKVAEIMFEEGIKKGLLSSKVVAEYETTGNIQDPSAKALVKSLVQNKIQQGLF